MEIRASYFDGCSAIRHPVRLRIDGDRLRLLGEGLEREWPLGQLRLAVPLGSLPRELYLPDGGKCEFVDRRFARSIEQQQGGGGFLRGVHRWENSLWRALLALGVTLGLLWAFVQFGIPQLATRAAYAVPPASEVTLGEQTLQALDRTLLEPTALPPKRQAELERLFRQVVRTLDAGERPYRLQLRRSPRIGANAFALPGGIVILTDDLVALADRDEQLAAVLAHEVGHVRHRHAMRQVIQNSAVGLLIATLTGDVFSATSLAAALPTMLVDAKFSRDMERQADDVAVEYLTRRGESVAALAEILTSLEQAHGHQQGSAGAKGSAGLGDYFSSHPATAERIARLRQGH